MRLTPRHRPRLLVVVLLASLLAAACGSSSSTTTSKSSADPSAAAPIVLKIGDPGNQGPLAYAKKTGALASVLAKVNAKIEWGGSYPSFTATIYAIHAGAVNFTQAAISPVLGYLSTSNDLKLFAFEGTNQSPGVDAVDGLVVLPHSSITSVKDLVGKTVAVNQAGHGQYLLLLALQQAGVPVDEVKQVFLNPEQASAALASGKVDAEYAIVNAYPAALAAGARVIVTSASLPSQDLTVFAAKTTLLQQHPEVARAFLTEYNKLIAVGNKNPKLFQNVFLSEGPTATSGGVLQEQTNATQYALPFHTAQPSDAAAVKSVSDLFVKYGVLKQPVSPAGAVFDLATAK